MDVDEIKNAMAVQLNPDMQERPLPRNCPGLTFRWGCGDLTIAGCRSEVVLVLMMLKNLEATEDDKIALVIDLYTIFGHGRDLMVSGVGRVHQQFRQRQQTTRLSRLLLTVHLLEDQDICPEPEKLRSHKGNTLIERWLLPRLIVEVFQVKRRNA
jgi:hypothetical protein